MITSGQRDNTAMHEGWTEGAEGVRRRCIGDGLGDAVGFEEVQSGSKMQRRCSRADPDVGGELPLADEEGVPVVFHLQGTLRVQPVLRPGLGEQRMDVQLEHGEVLVYYTHTHIYIYIQI